MSGLIQVINPNSNRAVTAAIDLAMDPFRSVDGPKIECIGLDQGPIGIETQGDCDKASVLVTEHIRRNESAADAFVIACYSDPGAIAAKEVTTKPVIGSARAALATAAGLGARAGVISILDVAVPRHWRLAREAGLDAMIAADLPIGLHVAELADETKARDRIMETGRRLLSDHGAQMLILGCAGMARYRAPLEQELGVTVIDPTHAATAMAIALLRLRRADNR
ncbi:aspartate/glutamate racemase family protein [Hwanghaeella sp.]|uniref:aspartate/glutamate racemase family protein n=1 Tax=Hwanghaeella sp. TaxID=2605943 RepID=UPI003CCB767A